MTHWGRPYTLHSFISAVKQIIMPISFISLLFSLLGAFLLLNGWNLEVPHILHNISEFVHLLLLHFALTFKKATYCMENFHVGLHTSGDFYSSATKPYILVIVNHVGWSRSPVGELLLGFLCMSHERIYLLLFPCFPIYVSYSLRSISLLWKEEARRYFAHTHTTAEGI